MSTTIATTPDFAKARAEYDKLPLVKTSPESYGLNASTIADLMVLVQHPINMQEEGHTEGYEFSRTDMGKCRRWLKKWSAVVPRSAWPAGFEG